jgi:23S rRNA (uracil1939-C5)-methyltransferase
VVWGALRAAFDTLPRERALRVAVRLLDDGASVTVEGGRSWREPEALLALVPAVSEVWWRPEEGMLRRVAARTDERQAGAAFVQVNAGVAARLRERLLARVRSYAPEHVVDAYAGTGATARPLAADGRRVTAIELDRAAVETLREGLAAPNNVIGGKVEDHIARALPADVVLLNPPRTGVDERVTAALESRRTDLRALFYVSCDPATLARDLARLPGYRLVGVRGYDMFPQTAHVETLCELVPEAA